MTDLFEMYGVQPDEPKDLYEQENNGPIDLFEKYNIPQKNESEATGFPGIWGDIKNMGGEAAGNIPGMIAGLPEALYHMGKSGATMPYESAKAYGGGIAQALQNQSEAPANAIQYFAKRFGLNVPTREQLIENMQPQYKDIIKKHEDIQVPWEPKKGESWAQFANPKHYQDPGLQGFGTVGELSAPLKLAKSLKIGSKAGKIGAETGALMEQALANKQNPFEIGAFPALGQVASSTLKAIPKAWNSGVRLNEARKGTTVENPFEKDIQTSKSKVLTELEKHNTIESKNISNLFNEWETDAGKNEIAKPVSKKDLGISERDVGDNGVKLLEDFTELTYPFKNGEISKTPKPKTVLSALKLYRQVRDQGINARNDAKIADNSALSEKYYKKAKRLDEAKDKIESVIRGNISEAQYAQFKKINKQFQERIIPVREKSILEKASRKFGGEIPNENILQILQGKNIPVFMKNIKENHPELAKAIIEHDFKDLNFNDIKAMENAVKADTMGYIPEDIRSQITERIKQLKYEKKVQDVASGIKSIGKAGMTLLAGKGALSFFR